MPGEIHQQLPIQNRNRNGAKVEVPDGRRRRRQVSPNKKKNEKNENKK